MCPITTAVSTFIAWLNRVASIFCLNGHLGMDQN
jgi:hypothetical protein